MQFALSRFGTTFATRERARELIAAVGNPSDGRKVTVSLEGVTASPSFLAEFLRALATRFLSVEFQGGTQDLQDLAASLTEKLGLTGRVTQAQRRSDLNRPPGVGREFDEPMAAGSLALMGIAEVIDRSTLLAMESQQIRKHDAGARPLIERNYADSLERLTRQLDATTLELDRAVSRLLELRDGYTESPKRKAANEVYVRALTRIGERLPALQQQMRDFPAIAERLVVTLPSASVATRRFLEANERLSSVMNRLEGLGHGAEPAQV